MRGAFRTESPYAPTLLEIGAYGDYSVVGEEGGDRTALIHASGAAELPGWQ